MFRFSIPVCDWKDYILVGYKCSGHFWSQHSWTEQLAGAAGGLASQELDVSWILYLIRA
ncbi:hypothetical protein KP509_07G084200 [Ceratopteris richardii]|uniref:Uncharacterized protein n=1 Tax=Ceratopteris richardii TaxID=49495 RepID=A0A8T2UE66_CERRI|nr:hypothetical protein KP509_07G084200 [Ceratopteris richardii]